MCKQSDCLYIYMCKQCVYIFKCVHNLTMLLYSLNVCFLYCCCYVYMCILDCIILRMLQYVVQILLFNLTILNKHYKSYCFKGLDYTIILTVQYVHDV